MGEWRKFSGKADEYDKARPGYPPEVMRYIASLLPERATVADIGAGTGKFTVPLADLGVGDDRVGRGSRGSRDIRVEAVEPDPDMRAHLTAALADRPNATVVAAPAEHTTLPDHSVDVITCAQSLHWFDPDAFRAECARIARDDTYLLISLYNITSFDSALKNRLSGGAESAATPSDGTDTEAGTTAERRHIVGSREHLSDTTAEFFHAPTVRAFPNPMRYTREGWLQYMDSHSHSPLPGDPAYAAHRAWANGIFDRDAVDGILTTDTTCTIVSELLHR